MNKIDYYRILGVREDATVEKINAAYKERIKRLSSADFTDEPEYAARKKAEVSHAYAVVTGRAAPISKMQKLETFQRKKDAIEEGENGMAVRPKKMIFLNPPLTSSKGKTNKPDAKKISLATVLSIVIGVAGIVGGTMFDNISQNEAPIYESYEYEEWLDADNINLADYAETDMLKNDYDVIAQIKNSPTPFDFTRDLNYHEEKDTTPFDYQATEYEQDQIHTLILEICKEINLMDLESTVDVIMDEEGYFSNHQPSEYGQVIAAILGAPAPYEISGMANEFSDDRILNVAEYFDYLRNVVVQQSEYVLNY